MAKNPLISRVPEIWRRLDKDDVSRNLFSAIDAELENIGLNTEGYLDFINVDRVSYKLLPLLGSMFGHVWREDKTPLWNRNRIRYTLKRASYRGTTTCLRDTIEENGAEINNIQDNASMIMVLDKQGNLDGRNCHFQDADTWHDGVFEIDMNIVGDISELPDELEAIRPAGFTWLLSYSIHISPPVDEDTENITPGESVIEFFSSIWSTDIFNDCLDFGGADKNIWLSFVSDRADNTIEIKVVAHREDTHLTQVTGLDGGMLDRNIYLSFECDKKDISVETRLSGEIMNYISEEVDASDSAKLDTSLYVSFESDRADNTIEINKE